MFLEFAEVVACIVLLIVVVTQIIIPLWQNRPMFPMFDRNRNLDDRLANAKTEYDSAVRLKEIVELEQKTKEVLTGLPSAESGEATDPAPNQQLTGRK